MADVVSVIRDADVRRQSRRSRHAVQENGNARETGSVTATVIGIETVTAAETVIETETVTAAEIVIETETVRQNVRIVRAIMIPALNPALMRGRLATLDAGVMTNNIQINTALSFPLTKGKGNDKLFFDTSLHMFPVLRAVWQKIAE